MTARNVVVKALRAGKGLGAAVTQGRARRTTIGLSAEFQGGQSRVDERDEKGSESDGLRGDDRDGGDGDAGTDSVGGMLGRSQDREGDSDAVRHVGDGVGECFFSLADHSRGRGDVEISEQPREYHSVSNPNGKTLKKKNAPN